MEVVRLGSPVHDCAEWVYTDCMDLDQILALIDADIAVLQQARAILVGTPSIQTYPKRRVAARRRKLSTEAKEEIYDLERKKLVEAQKAADLKEKGRLPQKEKNAGKNH